MKLKAANYEIEHLTTDYREMSQREAVLVDEGRQKDEIIQKLRKELEILQHRDAEAEHQISELTDQNNALSDTLKETNNALETLQNELYELRAKLKNAPNNNDLDAEEEKEKEHLFPAVQARTRSQPSSRGADDEPDEASQSYSAEGYANNVRKKAKHPGTPGTPENGYYSDSDGDTKLKRNKGDVGVKGLRAKSKKKKDHSTDSILPMINQKRGGSESVISSLSVEEKDYSDDDDRKKRKHLKSRSQLDSARDSASVAYKIAQPLADERHTKQQKLIFERQISGGCTQCGKKIKGEPKRLPSSLKNLVVDGIDSSSQVSAPKSKDSCQSHSVISEAFFAGKFANFLKSRHDPVGYPILENHLDHQLAVRDKYSHPRGQHCNFCSWDCAKYVILISLLLILIL